MSIINLHTSPVQEIKLLAAQQKNIRVSVLRLDLVHPVVSGNKWFKLKEYLQEAEAQGKKIIGTFGGAYSNHIVATAAACKETGLQAVGIIRGEKPESLSHTLQQAMNLGMQLFFVSRNDYRVKKLPDELPKNLYLINEGGYGLAGMRGASTILDGVEANTYTHICTAVGTGTTLAGLVEASKENHQCIGISVLKNNFSLQEEINALLSEKNQNRFSLLHTFHFGGYAKYTQELLHFINEWYRQTGIPSDFVYTGKMFYGISQLLKENYFPPQSHLLLVHTGGLQGNGSLPKGTLIFHN